MRHLPLALFVATLGLSGCALDTGVAPTAPNQNQSDTTPSTPADATPDDADGPGLDAQVPPANDTTTPPTDNGPVDDDAPTPSPDTATPPDATTPSDATEDGGTTEDGGPTLPDAEEPTGSPAPPLAPTVWPATFTTPLTGGGWTLRPLGARRGFTGVISAPDGSFTLEALP